MKSTVIVATLLAVSISASAMPALAEANTGGSASSVDKVWCKKLEGYFNRHLAEAKVARTRLTQTNALEEAMYWLNVARHDGCPWAKNATIPW